MKIGIGNDHHGVKLKNKLSSYLQKHGFEVINYGSDLHESVDYPDYAALVGNAVSQNEIDYGILICNSGIGMSIACNRIKGARCAKINTLKEAKSSRLHNNANVVALASTTPYYKVKDIIDIFVKTPYSNEERHNNRIAKIERNVI